MLEDKLEEEVAEEAQKKEKEDQWLKHQNAADLPLWKKKHVEMDKKKADISEKWKKVRRQVSAAEAFKLRNDRKFHPSFDSVKGNVFKKHSVERYKMLGYPSNTARKYQNYWNQKIEKLMRLMLSESEVRRGRERSRA